MTKIIAFAGSNSSTSINQALVECATSQFENVETIKLVDYDIPMYSIDLEKSGGMPADISKLVEQLQNADYAVIGCPEHNGLMPAFFKNILDWLSRTGVKYMETTPIVLLSTSPGGGGAKGGLASVERILGYAKGEILGTYNLPSFSANFDLSSKEITNDELKSALNSVMAKIV